MAEEPDPAEAFALHIPGHCYSKKNHREIHSNRRTGRRFLGKSDRLSAYEEYAVFEIRRQWRGRPTLMGPVRVALKVWWYRAHPDALGPAETVYDVLEHAGVVKNDRQLIPWGTPAVERIKVSSPEDERVEVTVEAEA
ncbi:MAG: hypothetical protein WC789_09450 [Lentisphaeria bacterium]